MQTKKILNNLKLSGPDEIKNILGHHHIFFKNLLTDKDFSRWIYRWGYCPEQ